MLAQNLGVPPQNLLVPKAGGTADGILREDESVIKEGLWDLEKSEWYNTE